MNPGPESSDGGHIDSHGFMGSHALEFFKSAPTSTSQHWLASLKPLCGTHYSFFIKNQQTLFKVFSPRC